MGCYDDIINLPHFRSEKHPPMAIENRAAQFAPFAALSGYEDAVTETGRLTNTKTELDETQKQEINSKLLFLQDTLNEKHTVKITYFVNDKLKNGGKYITSESYIKKINIIEHSVTMADNTVIPIDDILSIDGEIFNYFDY